VTRDEKTKGRRFTPRGQCDQGAHAEHTYVHRPEAWTTGLRLYWACMQAGHWEGYWGELAGVRDTAVGPWTWEMPRLGVSNSMLLWNVSREKNN
jgi:hypothetical protein